MKPSHNDKLSKIRTQVESLIGISRTQNTIEFPEGLTGLGIGINSPADLTKQIGIIIYSLTKKDQKRFKALVGEEVEQVPIYYCVTGILKAL